MGWLRHGNSGNTGHTSNGSLFRTAEYPGFKSAKQAARGGSVREVTTKKALNSVTRTKTSDRIAIQGAKVRREQEARRKALIKERKDAAKAKKVAKQAKRYAKNKK